MRRIAANYILLPGYPLVKAGYVVLDGKKVVDVIDTGGKIREIQGLEFYGGMIIAGDLSGEIPLLKATANLLVAIEEIYSGKKVSDRGLLIIKGADLVHFTPLSGMLIERLV